MKLIGALLIFTSAIWCYFSICKESRRALQLGDALVADLAILRYEICIFRRSLPWILEERLCKDSRINQFWNIFLSELPKGTVEAWKSFIILFPDPLDSLLGPLGQHLAAGEDTLARAIDETRAHLTEYISCKRHEQTNQERLRCGLLLSVACFLVLILV